MHRRQRKEVRKEEKAKQVYEPSYISNITECSLEERGIVGKMEGHGMSY